MIDAPRGGSVRKAGFSCMKARILTGLVGGALLFVVLLVLPPIFLNIAMAAVCALAMYEVLVVTKAAGNRGLVASAVVFSLAAPFLLLPEGWMPAALALLLYCVALVFIQIRYHETLKVERTGFVFFVSVLVSISFSCLAYLRAEQGAGGSTDGLFYVFLAIVMAWMCDMGAYFVGTFLGKHKMCPKISPKKTIEGLAGGFVVAIGSSVLAGFLYQLYLDHMQIDAAVSLWQVALLALVCAPLSVMGDLLASIIKRQFQVKDFGHIMPGHGGMMDRFDSLMFVAPLTFVVVQYFPLVY